MYRCPKCHKEVSNKDKKCPHCGEKLIKTNKSLFPQYFRRPYLSIFAFTLAAIGFGFLTIGNVLLINSVGDKVVTNDIVALVISAICCLVSLAALLMQNLKKFTVSEIPLIMLVSSLTCYILYFAISSYFMPERLSVFIIFLIIGTFGLVYLFLAISKLYYFAKRLSFFVFSITCLASYIVVAILFGNGLGEYYAGITMAGIDLLLVCSILLIFIAFKSYPRVAVYVSKIETVTALDKDDEALIKLNNLLEKGLITREEFEEKRKEIEERKKRK